MAGPFSFWLLPGVIFHRHHAIFVLCEDNKWPNRYQQTAGGVSTDRGWKRGPKCCWINWCSLSLTPRLSPPFQTCTTNTFNASNASFVGGGRLIETDRRREWEIFTRFTRYSGPANIGCIRGSLLVRSLVGYIHFTYPIYQCKLYIHTFRPPFCNPHVAYDLVHLDKTRGLLSHIYKLRKLAVD